ncbi:laccase-14-like [Rhodamnia argentea]|uniref:Laccase n=1 Tax=Rhodamnia argentea TaxID=178133 RepID=A0A8B8QDA5_9MYRT|nr:laccase-14-like [Rhodamnia argentea]
MKMESGSVHATSALLYLLVAAAFLLRTAHAKVHYYDFVLREKNYTRLCSTKSMLVVNDSFPGPVIRVQKGDTVFVNVHNQGYYGLTIHWHGVKQPRNPWSDGPEYVTQCPIQPGTNFTYEVIFSKEEGTLWWHAHSDWTRSSVHGAIVIYPGDGTSYPYTAPDDEEIIVLGSWYTADVNQEVAEDMVTGADTPRSVSYVINGQPGDFANCSKNSTYRRVVDYGKTYLVRIVNADMNAELFLAIAEHNMTVVGLDGNYVKPVTVDFIVISPGQTMDVLVTMNQAPGHYYLAIRQYDSARPDVTDYDKTNVTAIFMYSGNNTAPANPVFPHSLPTYEDFIAADIFLGKLRSLASAEHPVDVPMNVTTKMYITVEMNQILCPNASCEGINGNRLSSSLNNISFLNPSTDVLLAYYRNLSGYYTLDFPNWPPTMFNFTQSDLPFNTTVPIQATKVKMLEYNEEVEMTFQGTEVLNASENHPMHLHGYSFYVMGSGYGNFDNNTDPLTYNYDDPLEVNTIGVPKNGWVTIRFKASNPGVWFWHCHLDRHLSWGMSTVMIVKNGGTPETSIRSPPPNMPACEASFATYLEPLDDQTDQNRLFAD